MLADALFAGEGQRWAPFLFVQETIYNVIKGDEGVTQYNFLA